MTDSQPGLLRIAKVQALPHQLGLLRYFAQMLPAAVDQTFQLAQLAKAVDLPPLRIPTSRFDGCHDGRLQRFVVLIGDDEEVMVLLRRYFRVPPEFIRGVPVEPDGFPGTDFELVIRHVGEVVGLVDVEAVTARSPDLVRTAGAKELNLAAGFKV